MKKPDRLRLFIAISLPGSIRENISRLNRELAERLEGIRWAKASNIHLTLKFLGEVEAARIPEIQARIDRAAEGRLPLAARLGGLGAFPPRGTPRVIWAGLEEGREPVAALAGELSLELSELGFPEEARLYSPHLTLGRVKSGRRAFDPGVLSREIERRRGESLGSFTVDMIILMESTLTPEGAIHRVVSRHGRRIR
jgi:RNA 2',3'-cyclic 3'-phosphodiesterase